MIVFIIALYCVIYLIEGLNIYKSNQKNTLLPFTLLMLFALFCIILYLYYKLPPLSRPIQYIYEIIFET